LKAKNLNIKQMFRNKKVEMKQRLGDKRFKQTLRKLKLLNKLEVMVGERLHLLRHSLGPVQLEELL
jgi:hypothetical protein